MKVLLPFIVGFILLIYGALPLYAASEYIQGGVIVNPAESYKRCDDQSVCTDLGTCWNDASPGSTECGTACRVGGSPFGNSWTKYRYDYCAEFALNKRTDTADCRPVYRDAGVVCSTGDKCTASHPYLNSGKCDCSTGGIYKTCCSNSGGLAGNSCVAYAVDDTNPPWEGVCPGGSYEQPCGYGGYPACGAAACGSSYPYPTPDYGSPAGPTCTGRYDVTCCDGTTDALTCPDKAIWDSAGLTYEDWASEACNDNGGYVDIKNVNLLLCVLM